MKKLLFPISEPDYFTTQGRLSYIIQALEKEYSVEVLTTSQRVYDDATQKLLACPNVKVSRIDPKIFPLSFDMRDHLARISISYSHELCLSGTDLRLWKISAADDFWGHLSLFGYPDLKLHEADITLLPLLSTDEFPWEETDVLYTFITVLAKEAGKKMIGYQLYPVFNSAYLMPRIMDAIIVRKDYEKQFHMDIGIPSDKIHLLTDPRDRYALSMIEDPYCNAFFHSETPVLREELAITITNHAKYRPQILQILRAIEESGIPTVVSILKKGFTVMDSSEDQVIEEMYANDFNKAGCRVNIVESQALIPTIMNSDVVVGPTYVGSIQLAGRYHKRAWVYNPLTEVRLEVDGVRFINEEKDLLAALALAYTEKLKLIGMLDILNRIVRV